VCHFTASIRGLTLVFPSHSNIRPLQQAAVFPDQVQCGIGLDKLEAMPKCVPIAHRGEDGHATYTQLQIQLHDLPNRKFDRQRG